MSLLRKHLDALDAAQRRLGRPRHNPPDGNGVADLSERRRDTAPMQAAAPPSENVDRVRRSFLPRAVRDQIQPYTPPGTDLAVYSHEITRADGARVYYAVAFQGRAARPLWHHGFRTAEARQEYIDQTAEGRHAGLGRRASARAQRRAFVPTLKVGDILYASWGYDQTNIDFYEVVEAAGKSVVVRQIAQRDVASDGGQDRVVAVPGHYVGPPMRKIVGQGNAVKVGHQHASPWDGKPKYQTSAMTGH